MTTATNNLTKQKDINMSAIDISSMNKAEVLMKLFNASKVQGLGFLQGSGNEVMTKEEATDILNQTPSAYFDYLKGRIMKIDLSGDTMRTEMYNRDNGQGAAERALINL